MSNISLSFFFISLFFSLKSQISLARTDSISRTSPLIGNQTLISKEGKFELGFFKPSKNSNNYYIGVWYKSLPQQTVVWVANRVEPVTDPHSSQLKISNDGNLVLLNGSNHQIWSTNTTSKATHATLSDTSNLILKNGSGLIVWQSFDHPTDTQMPGGWMEYDKITQEYIDLTCWESLENPAPGPFTLRVNPNGSYGQYVILWNNSNIYATNEFWIGNYIVQIPNSGLTTPSYVNTTVIDSWDRIYETYTVSNSSILTRGVIHSNGQHQQFWWFNNTQEWQPVLTQPISQCDVYSLCGSYGICDSTNSNICNCIRGFEPISIKDWDSNDFNKGCVRKTKLQCAQRNDTEKDGFIKMGNVRLPDKQLSLPVLGQKECEITCLGNCSCVAYSYNNGCLIWNDEIRNLEQYYEGGNNNGGDIYIRLAASDLPNSSNSKKVIIEVVIGVTIGAILIILSIFCMISLRGKWTRTTMQKKMTKYSLIMFSYSDLLIVTKNFSERLGGGGFGSVFKGSLPDLTEVAIKKLEGVNQGEKQFRAEVSTLGAIQHVNLVKLLGFCSERDKRLVVYEYMPGGSLENVLFNRKRNNLNWKMRYHIILGIARGITYLHEECIERIIHCDVKPDNILLDSNFCAKVADFGMAKLIGRDISRVLTTMRGTIGYLAPEWLSGQPVTTKVDVYSFGMMLFEIISGKRNFRDFEKDAMMGYFPSWAAKQVIDDNIVNLLDEKLQDSEYDMDELKRACRIACWCIQDLEFHRPCMSQVVKVLEGVLEVNVPPLPRALGHFMDEKINYDSYSTADFEVVQE
ncbi:hypothetical protein LUZ60_014294 [Juncus effusus]|nr:hypothetical protein LUZ60_014294 [Juncus effusus]